MDVLEFLLRVREEFFFGLILAAAEADSFFSHFRRD
jgi:hypothetical protein